MVSVSPRTQIRNTSVITPEMGEHTNYLTFVSGSHLCTLLMTGFLPVGGLHRDQSFNTVRYRKTDYPTHHPFLMSKTRLRTRHVYVLKEGREVQLESQTFGTLK